jgi:hypothetical protein
MSTFTMLRAIVHGNPFLSLLNDNAKDFLKHRFQTTLFVYKLFCLCQSVLVSIALRVSLRAILINLHGWRSHADKQSHAVRSSLVLPESKTHTCIHFIQTRWPDFIRPWSDEDRTFSSFVHGFYQLYTNKINPKVTRASFLLFYRERDVILKLLNYATMHGVNI